MAQHFQRVVGAMGRNSVARLSDIAGAPGATARRSNCHSSIYWAIERHSVASFGDITCARGRAAERTRGRRQTASLCLVATDAARVALARIRGASTASIVAAVHSGTEQAIVTMAAFGRIHEGANARCWVA